MSKIVFPSETMAETHFALRTAKSGTAPITRNPLKRLLGGMTALAVAGSLVLASAAPSHADRRGDNLAKALAAAIVLGLIVNNANKGNGHPAPAPAPKPLPVKKPRVPGVCAIEIESDRGYPVTVYSESCMRDEGFDYRLPDCARSVRIYGQRDRIYSAQCLRDAGFRVGGH